MVARRLRFALLFPGQGAQFVGMGRDLAEAFPAAKALFEQADAALGYPLSQLCWEGPSEELTRTEHCQPAIYVCSMAAWAALKSTLHSPLSTLYPSAAAGLSLGEYTALAAAGAFSFQDGLRLVNLRGKAMEEAARMRPGTMASVLGLGLEPLKAICAETGAEVANLTAPGQIVISGPTEAVRAASEKAKASGAKRVVPLDVGGAFHSRLMQPASDRLKEAVQRVEMQLPTFPVLSDVTGEYYAQLKHIKVLLVEQLTHPVLWTACMGMLVKEGIQTYLEVGPGTVLKGLCRKIHPDAQVHSVGTVEEVRLAAALLATGG